MQKIQHNKCSKLAGLESPKRSGNRSTIKIPSLIPAICFVCFQEYCRGTSPLIRKSNMYQAKFFRISNWMGRLAESYRSMISIGLGIIWEFGFSIFGFEQDPSVSPLFASSFSVQYCIGQQRENLNWISGQHGVSFLLACLPKGNVNWICRCLLLYSEK